MNTECHFLVPARGVIVDIYSDSYKIFDKGLSLIVEGKTGCKAYGVDYSNNYILVWNDEKICLFELVEVHEELVKAIMLIAALIGVFHAAFSKLSSR